jgi:hypothetical protein
MKLSTFLEKMEKWRNGHIFSREWNVEVEWDMDDVISINMMGLKGGDSEITFRRAFGLPQIS